MAQHGPDALWGLREQLLAAVVDGIAAGNWQRGGGRGARPKPIHRPGTKRDDAPKTMGKGAGLTAEQVMKRQVHWARGKNEGKRRERKPVLVGEV